MDKLVGSMVEEMALAIRAAIDASPHLAAGPRDVGEEYHGEKRSLLYVDGAFDLDALAQACAAIAQKRVNELEERVRTLEFHVAQRGAALAPFAEACSNCIDDEPDNGSTWEHPVGMEVTFRDFRDARDVLDLPSAALPTTEVPGESEEEMK